jgi:retron-type reverse transcriptase
VGFRADIKACFDEIDHVALMDRLRVRIKDKRVCALVKAFLKSGVMTTAGDRLIRWRRPSSVLGSIRSSTACRAGA